MDSFLFCNILHCTLVVASQVCGGSHPLQHYMHLQCRRVRSLNFLPVAVLVVGSPSASHFVRLGDITPPAAMIGYL